MGNYEELKAAVAAVIKQNGNEEITGQIMQNTLLSMISNIGANSTFAGVATPETVPGTPDQNVFYLAGTPGVYANFGGYELKQGIVMFTNASGAFTAVDLGFSNDNLKRLFLVDKSIIGIPNIDYDHLYNIPGGGAPGLYIDNNTFDTGWAIVPIDSGYMSVSGANITRVLFFSDINPVAANLINTFATNFQLIPIPATAKLALITLRKANNPEGYKNLRVSQPGAAATRSDVSLLKQRLYKNRSFSGKVDIDANMLVNIISGNVNYIPDTAFDVAFVDIFDKSKYLEITGATIVRVSFFSDYEINTANYISNTTNYITTIPSNAVMATITLRKTDNTDGYNNLRVNQNGAAPSSLRLLQNTGELFTEKSLFFNRSGNPITTTEYLTTTGFLPITGKDDIVVKGANNASVPVITFWDAHYKFIAPIAQTEQTTNRVYTVAAADIPAGAKYIRCTRNENETDVTDSYIVGVNIAALLSMRENIIPEFKQVITGKNLINPANLLRGITYSSSSGLITNADGILSNKLRLSPGTYTIKGVAPYSAVQTTVRILRFNDKNEMVYADAITLDANKEGHYTVNAGTSGVGGNGYIDYWRIVLQFNTAVLFDPTVAQFEKNSVATEFEPCQTKLIENPAYNLTPRMAFMTGASSSMPGNGYFETACELLGFKHRNEAISGDSVMKHATRAWRGLIYEADGRMSNNYDNAGNFVGLYTFEELENIDIFVTSHIHNYDVAFEGKVFEKVETTFGYYSVTGVFYPSGAWALDKYNLSPNDTKLIVNTFTSESTTPHALFFDRNNNFISGDIIFDPAVSNTPIIDREIDVPENAAYVLIKRMYFPGSITKVRGVGYGILQKTVAEYEAKGYDASNNPLTVPMDKTDLTQRIVPYGSYGGAPGAQVSNNLYDERYAAGYDYLLKKYALDCYNLRLNPDSKYYGTKSGKPVIIVCTTQWHDGYVRFNDSVKIMAKRHGAIVCDVANNVGFSYLQTDPTNDDSIRWGALHCNNAAIGSGNDTETIPIHGVMYTGMGWHPTRQWDCYIQMKRAQILAETMRLATYNNGDFGQII